MSRQKIFETPSTRTRTSLPRAEVGGRRLEVREEEDMGGRRGQEEKRSEVGGQRSECFICQHQGAGYDSIRKVGTG